jgi:hypothetical protein
MADQEPDYGHLSLTELQDVAAHINPELVPERYARLQQELRARAERGECRPAVKPWWQRVEWLRLVAVSEMIGACLGMTISFTALPRWLGVLAFMSSLVIGIGGVLLWRSSVVGYFISVAAQIPQLLQIACAGLIGVFTCGFDLPVGFRVGSTGPHPFISAGIHYTLNLLSGPTPEVVVAVNLAAVASLVILWKHRNLLD